MASTYKITFRPVEPYFFGNEKNFIFPGQEKGKAYASSYFIRSEKTPSQSTILGALRYIFLPYKWKDLTGDNVENKKKENKAAVGEESFNLSAGKLQSFGKIKKISPIFICGKNDFGEDVTLIPTPMDHNKTKKVSERVNPKTGKSILKYEPFREYIQVETSENVKLYANDFDVKEGLEHSYVSVENGEIYDESDIFVADLRIGINRFKEKDGFFKKEYRMLKGDFSFAVYAELDAEEPQPQCVFLGQGKSAFMVTFEKEANGLEEKVKAFLERYKHSDEQLIYCFGDTYVSDFADNEVLFCAVDTRDYRSFTTEGKGQFKKDDKLYKLLKAGSIVITKNASEWVSKNTDENAQNIGFNTFVISGGKEK